MDAEKSSGLQLEQEGADDDHLMACVQEVLQQPQKMLNNSLRCDLTVHLNKSLL